MSRKLTLIMLGIAVSVSAMWLYTGRQESEPPPVLIDIRDESPSFPVDDPTEPPPISTEPATGTLSTEGYVYDLDLGYGFEYPGGWEFFINVDTSICDLARKDAAKEPDGEPYSCLDFPDRSIKKVVVFEKFFGMEDTQLRVGIEFMVRLVDNPEEFIDEFKRYAKDSGVPVLSEHTVSTNNIERHDILLGGPILKLRQVAFFADGRAYIFQYSSSTREDLYDRYEDSFGRIVNSFEIRYSTH